jgi:alkylhydroperoxidase family enzyme
MSHGDHITQHRGAIRFILFALGIPQALIGVWALAAPRSFYDDFPAGTDGWVHVLGPFDEHLVTDIGALFIALGFLLAFAADTLRRGTVMAAAISWLIFSVPHFLWHVFNLDEMSTADAVANTATLAWTVTGGILVLALLRRPRPEPMERTPNGNGRIQGVQDGKGGLFARMAFQYSKREYGAVMDPTRVYALHPMLMMGYGALETATSRADRLPEDIKALAATKAAALAGCEFCMDIASMISTKAGVTEAKLRALPDHATSPEFSDVERLVLDFAVGMTRTPVDVSDDLFARLREHFDEAQLVELANEIAIENYRARFNWAFDIGAQGFTEGAFCVRPETVPAAESVRPHA